LPPLAGFIPGLYRDPKVIVEQSHGYDLGNFVAVLVPVAIQAAASRRIEVGELLEAAATPTSSSGWRAR
jgi:hypothetical protein